MKSQHQQHQAEQKRKKAAVRRLNKRKRNLQEIARQEHYTPKVATFAKGLENTAPPRPLEGIHDSKSVSTLRGGITFHREHQHSNPEKEVEVLKCILLREGYIERLVRLAKREQRPTDVVVDLFDLIRNVTLETIEQIVLWRRGLPSAHESGAQFIWNGLNYLLRIPSDLDFLAKYSEISSWCPAVRNPLLVPKPLDNARSNGSAVDIHQRNSTGSSKPIGTVKRLNPYETAVVNDPSLKSKKRGRSSRSKEKSQSEQARAKNTVAPPQDLHSVDMVRVHNAHTVLLQEEELYGQYMRNEVGLIVPVNKGNDDNNVHGTRTRDLAPPVANKTNDTQDRIVSDSDRAIGEPAQNSKVLKGRSVALKSGGDLLEMQRVDVGGRKQLPSHRSRGAKLEMTLKRKKKQVDSLRADLEMTERHAQALEEDLASNPNLKGNSRSRMQRELEFVRFELERKKLDLNAKVTSLEKLKHARDMQKEKQVLEQQALRAATLMAKHKDKMEFQQKVDVTLHGEMVTQEQNTTSSQFKLQTFQPDTQSEIAVSHNNTNQGGGQLAVDWEPYCATEIQKVIRGFQGRRRFQHFFVLYNTSAILLQATVRMLIGRNIANRKRLELDASILIQSFVRGEKARERVRQLRHENKCKKSAIMMQCVVRQMRGRIRMRRRKQLCRAVVECRQYACAISVKDLQQLAKLKSDEAPPNLLSLTECLLVTTARGTAPPVRQMSLSWKMVKRVYRDSNFLRKLRAMAEAAHHGVLLVGDDRVDAIAHHFCDPSLSQRALAEVGQGTVTEMERMKQNQKDLNDGITGASGTGITAVLLFQCLQQLLECQRLGKYFMADQPGESVYWQQVLACDNPDGRELWEPREDDYDSDAIDPRRYIPDHVLYGGANDRSRPMVVALASTIPTRVKERLVLHMKRMLPGTFVHVSDSQRDEWSCRMFGEENVAGFSRFVKQQEEELETRNIEEANVSEPKQNRERNTRLNVDVLQQIISSGKSILLDVNLGIGNKSKAAFLRIMVTIQRSLLPSPLFILVRGDAWNRGMFQPFTTTLTRSSLEDALAQQVCVPYREANLLGLDEHNLNQVGGRYGPKGCREKIANCLFELPTHEAHTQMCSLAQLDIPPDGLILLMEAIVVILNPQDVFSGPSDQHVKGVSWDTGAALLSLDPGVLAAQLRAVNLDTIPPKNLCALQAYTEHPSWPNLKAAEQVTTLLAWSLMAENDQRHTDDVETRVDHKLRHEKPAGSVAAQLSAVGEAAVALQGLKMTQLLERVPVLQLLVGFVDNVVRYGIALVREGGVGPIINRKTSVFSAVVVVRDGFDKLPAGYKLASGRHLTRPGGDLAQESDGLATAMNELLSAATKDVRVYSEARRIPGVKLHRKESNNTTVPLNSELSKNNCTTMIMAVARDQGRIFIDAYDPYMCKRFTTYVLDEDVCALLAPNSSELKQVVPEPAPRTTQQLCERLLRLATLQRPKRPEIVSSLTGPRLPTQLCLKRTRILLTQQALQLESFKAIVRLEECQLGEIMVKAYVPSDQSEHGMLIEYQTLERIARNTESDLERRDLESEQASRMVPHLLDRLGFRRSQGGLGSLKMVIRCSSGTGRKFYEGSVRMGGMKVYIVSLYLVSVDSSMRIEAYDQKTSKCRVFTLSRRARLELLGTLNQGKQQEWISNSFARLRNRKHTLVLDRTLLKLSLRVPFYIQEDLNAANGGLMIVEIINVDNGEALPMQTKAKRSRSKLHPKRKKRASRNARKGSQLHESKQETTSTVENPKNPSSEELHNNVEDKATEIANEADHDSSTEKKSSSHNLSSLDEAHNISDNESVLASSHEVDTTPISDTDDTVDKGQIETIRFQVFDTAKSQRHVLRLCDNLIRRVLGTSVPWPIESHETQVELCSRLNAVAQQLRVGSSSGTGGVAPDEVVLVGEDDKMVLLRSSMEPIQPTQDRTKQSRSSLANKEESPRLPDYVSPHIEGKEAEVLHRVAVFEDETALANKLRPNGELVYRKAHVLSEREIDVKQPTSVDKDDLLDVSNDRDHLRARVVLSFWRKSVGNDDSTKPMGGNMQDLEYGNLDTERSTLDEHESKGASRSDSVVKIVDDTVKELSQIDSGRVEKESDIRDRNAIEIEQKDGNDGRGEKKEDNVETSKKDEFDETSGDGNNLSSEESQQDDNISDTDARIVNDVKGSLNKQNQSCNDTASEENGRPVYTLDCYDPITQKHQRLYMSSIETLMAALGPRQDLLDPEREEEMIEYLVQERLYLARTKETAKNGIGFQLAVVTSRIFGADKTTPVTHCDIKDERSIVRNENVVIAGVDRGTKIRSSGMKLKIVGDIQGPGAAEYWIITVFLVGFEDLLEEQGGGKGPLFRILGYNPKTQAKSSLVIAARELVEAVEGDRALLAPACRNELVDKLLPILRLHRQVRKADQIVFPWKQLVQEQYEREQESEEELNRQRQQMEISQQLIDMYNINDALVQKHIELFSQAIILVSPSSQQDGDNINEDEAASHFVVTANAVWLEPHGKLQLWIRVYDPQLGLSRSCCASRSFANDIAGFIAGNKPTSLPKEQAAEWRGNSFENLAKWVEETGPKAKLSISQRFSRVCQQCISVGREDIKGEANLRTLRVLLDESNKGRLGTGGHLDRLNEAVEMKKQREAEELEESHVDTITISSLRKGNCLLRTAHLLSGHFVVLSMYQLLQGKIDEATGILVHVYCPALSQHAAREVLLSELQSEVNEEVAASLVPRLSIRHDDVDNHMQLLLDGKVKP